MHIGDLTIVFTWYGRFAPETKWRKIREELNDFRRRLLYNDAIRFPPRSDPYFDASDEVAILIFPESTPSSLPDYLSGNEVAKALSTISGLFFDPREKPRELWVDIMKPHVEPTSLGIHWLKIPAPWPQVPFSTDVEPIAGGYPDLVMEVYIYARGFEPNDSFLKRVSLDTLAIYMEVKKENDGSRKPISKTAYISGIAKLTIDPPPQAGQVLITALDTLRIVHRMRELIFGYIRGPREFGTYIRNQRGQALAKVFLLIDPDGFDDQPVLTLPVSQLVITVHHLKNTNMLYCRSPNYPKTSKISLATFYAEAFGRTFERGKPSQGIGARNVKRTRIYPISRPNPDQIDRRMNTIPQSFLLRHSQPSSPPTPNHPPFLSQPSSPVQSHNTTL